MSVLIIYGHPTHDGHNGVVLEETMRKLKDEGYSYEILDLYEKNFNPLLSKEDLELQMKKEVSSEIQSYQDYLKKYDKYIFIYPVWWFSMPAIIKGFFDRVFTAGFAYRYSPKGIPIGLLKGKKALVLMTSGGPSLMYKFLIRIPFSHVKSTLRFCGISSMSAIQGKCLKLTPEKKQILKKFVNKNVDNFL